MAGWLETGLAIAILAAGPVIALVFELRGRRRNGAGSLPAEPCWTEAIGRDGGRMFERSECVNDALMAMDARAARGDYPIPGSSG